MINIPFYLVDAFTTEAFKGNPAAVCVMSEWPDDATLLKMAQEHNQSETAFIIQRDEENHYDIRWFTSQDEVDLCGHATLASAHVVFAELGTTSSTISLHSHTSGEWKVHRADDSMMAMDLPLRRGTQVDMARPDISRYLSGLGTAVNPQDVFETDRDIYFVFAPQVMAKIKPNFTLLAQCQKWVGVTSKGDGEFDCVSRFFTPGDSHEEDPVTGSAHCTIAPYWAEKLNKTTITAFQDSARGGILQCEVSENTVRISGRARTYLKGCIV